MKWLPSKMVDKRLWCLLKKVKCILFPIYTIYNRIQYPRLWALKPLLDERNDEEKRHLFSIKINWIELKNYFTSLLIFANDSNPTDGNEFCQCRVVEKQRSRGLLFLFLTFLQNYHQCHDHCHPMSWKNEKKKCSTI